MALAFALYGIRRQAAGHVPGERAATITITNAEGRIIGSLDVDADDAPRFSKAITEMIDTDFGPIEKTAIERLIAERAAGA
ncbi:hypothetical protein D5S17_23405 [Pseudonocardiaceae bacterium YIM PH 21723]|nr:hypothetical protein D5S17_23405 [Pseudonocardiaceae bacterium YIM PH 21723]